MAEKKNRKRGDSSSSVVHMVTRGRGWGAIVPVEDCPSPIVLGRRSEEETLEEASRSAWLGSLKSRFSELVKTV